MDRWTLRGSLNVLLGSRADVMVVCRRAALAARLCDDRATLHACHSARWPLSSWSAISQDSIDIQSLSNTKSYEKVPEMKILAVSAVPGPVIKSMYGPARPSHSGAERVTRPMGGEFCLCVSRSRKISPAVLVSLKH